MITAILHRASRVTRVRPRNRASSTTGRTAVRPLHWVGAMRFARMLVGTVSVVGLSFACGGSGADGDVGSSSEALSAGEYVSTATSRASATYIGDWEHDWGYVLGYLLPGAKIYASVVRNDSVYGLIGNSGYGAWDDGHHCGWVSLGGVKGSGGHSSVADVCPPPDNDFSLAHGQPTGLFRAGTVVVSNGDVQPAVVLPTCPDFTVYANYDPATRTFNDPDGAESPGRGTMPTPDDPNCAKYGVPQQAVLDGYCGFGTRFVSADGVAVEIKDTRRAGDVTPFGFMRAECIAGSQVGNPSQGAPPPLCGVLGSAGSLGPGGAVTSCDGQYTFVVQASDGNAVEYQGSTALWNSGTEGHAGDHLDMQGDGNLVLYAGGTPLWASGTFGHPGAFFAVQDDGNIVVYQGSTPLWARFGLAPSGGGGGGGSSGGGGGGGSGSGGPPPPPPPDPICYARCCDGTLQSTPTPSNAACRAAYGMCDFHGHGRVKHMEWDNQNVYGPVQCP
jgi:hypothetical protein